MVGKKAIKFVFSPIIGYLWSRTSLIASQMYRKTSIRAGVVVHAFAILHAMVTALCMWCGVDDSLVLTMMTMAMSIILCIMKGMTVEMTAVTIIMVNIVGLLLGTGGADLIGRFLDSGLAVHSISTFLTTEIIGWCIIWFTKIFRIVRPSDATVRSRMTLILGIFIIIFLLRLVFGLIFTRVYPSSIRAYDIIEQYLCNAPALLIFIAVNLLFIRAMHKMMQQKRIAAFIIYLVFIFATPVLMALFVGWDLPFGFDSTFSRTEFEYHYPVALLIEITCLCIIYMLNYAMKAKAEMEREMNKAHKAEFQYIRLKQQLNPHFLFNSLNILNYLVQEQKTEQASKYIQKLASLYRYMLQNEGEEVVRVKDEMTFVEMYVELLKVRYTEGFRFSAEIGDEACNRNVIPCSIQLLVENAIKHNAVEPDNPLEVKVFTKDDTIVVENNLVPKMSSGTSTGVGLNYIRQEYKDLAGAEPEIGKGGKVFRVVLPLL